MRFRKYIFSIISLLIVLMLSYYFYSFANAAKILRMMNANLEIEGIRLGMTEDEVISRWGPGEYVEGFGGHARNYADKAAMVSFPNDQDNDLYGRVSSIYFSSPEYSIFTVKIGDSMTEGIQKLKSRRFKPAKFTEDTFARGEFFIALRGRSEIEYIQIWFQDKNLRDRNY